MGHRGRKEGGRGFSTGESEFFDSRRVCEKKRVCNKRKKGEAFRTWWVTLVSAVVPCRGGASGGIATFHA